MPERERGIQTGTSTHSCPLLQRHVHRTKRRPLEIDGHRGDQLTSCRRPGRSWRERQRSRWRWSRRTGGALSRLGRSSRPSSSSTIAARRASAAPLRRAGRGSAPACSQGRRCRPSPTAITLGSPARRWSACPADRRSAFESHNADRLAPGAARDRPMIAGIASAMSRMSRRSAIWRRRRPSIGTCVMRTPAACSISSTATRWAAEPLPTEPKSHRAALAFSISSFTDPMPLLEFGDQVRGVCATSG